MADDRGFEVSKLHRFKVERLCVLPNPVNLRSHLLKRSEPAVFHGAVSNWACAKWTPEFLAAELGGHKTKFRLFSRSKLAKDESSRRRVAMETDCEFEIATLGEFIQWLNGCMEQSGHLARFERNFYWCYADYKYMAELFHDFPHLRQSVNWGSFGFPERSGNESTIWIGSKEASTPCHMDTYGCNLVAQIYGRKKWTLFPPNETPKLYPTRIPYEESSVFSQVHITNPDLSKFPSFAEASRYEVLAWSSRPPAPATNNVAEFSKDSSLTIKEINKRDLHHIMLNVILEPGDVLFVPKKWWHYVETLDTSISINTWIELESDHIERVREALIRTLVCALKKHEGADEKAWVNPTEQIGTHEHNMDYLYKALNAVKQTEAKKDILHHDKHSSGEERILKDERQFGCEQERNNISTDDLINCLTTSDVIDLLTVQLLSKCGISEIPEVHL